jgi:GNAT superfamily N-acetyltransferase
MLAEAPGRRQLQPVHAAADIEAGHPGGYWLGVQGSHPPAVDPALVRVWAAGWAQSRGAPPPALDSGGWRIELGLPEQRRRYVFAAPTPEIASLAHTIDEPWVFLKVCGEEAAVRALLSGRWRVRRTGTLMLLDPLAPATFRRLPDGYMLGVEEMAGVLHAEVTVDHGERAAWGRVVLVGALAVFDRIATDEHHRRLGLGTAVMGALTDAATAMGGRTGALVATPDGRALYQTIGWRDLSPYITADLPA